MGSSDRDEVEAVTPPGTTGRFNPSLVASLLSVDAIGEDPQNARQHDDVNLEAIRTSLKVFGQVKPIVYWTDPTRPGEPPIVIAGNGTYRSARSLGWTHIAAVEFTGSPRHARAYAIADNRTAELATWDVPILKTQMESLAIEWQTDGLDWQPEAVGFSEPALRETLGERPIRTQDDGLTNRERDQAATEPGHVSPIDGPILEVRPGDLWALGDHRLICGDSTDPATLARLMGDEKATLLHADPPYGLGKEAEGVLNDNLHAAKLDDFQLSWWRTCRAHLDAAASVYIWGQPVDLWRLWFTKLSAAEPDLHLQNEIVWDKGAQPGQSSSEMRSYAPNTERALFAMLGAQEVGNVNADTYWEGWEPLRFALNEEWKKTGWTRKQICEICDVTNRMIDHWFGRSQWALVAEEKWEKLRAAGGSFNAFQHDYSAVLAIYQQLRAKYDREVMQPFYASRAFFDNVHDNMNEVWCFPRVVGEERWNHATPKPVALMCRVIKSSCPSRGVVLEPFIGSGSTLIAAEATARRCYGIEMQSKYVAATIARWEQTTGKKAMKV